jgi:hypothetical protein
VSCVSGVENRKTIYFPHVPRLGWFGKVHRWFGLTSVLPESISSLIESFLTCFRTKKNGVKGILLVWHAVLWAFWRARNEKDLFRKNCRTIRNF